jgi:hypothetical protein
MNSNLLLSRLEQIGHSLAQSGHALALIGLGSVGEDMHRLDQYSDLDFFAIVEPNYKHRYIENLDWLSNLGTIAYQFQNTPDGHKLLFADSVFCEFAVFHPQELLSIPFSPGRIIWQRDNAPSNMHLPTKELIPVHKTDKEFLIGEALTNLYVGMGRDQRGEKLSAARLIQGQAVDRLIELADYIEVAQDATRDVFASERRFEMRHPLVAQELPSWMQGYERNRESALAMLAFLEQHFEINREMADAIRKLCV